MTSDILLGELVLPGILAVVVFVVSFAALVLGRRWATSAGAPPRALDKPTRPEHASRRGARQPSKEPRLRVIPGGATRAASRA